MICTNIYKPGDNWSCDEVLRDVSCVRVCGQQKAKHCALPFIPKLKKWPKLLTVLGSATGERGGGKKRRVCSVK